MTLSLIHIYGRSENNSNEIEFEVNNQMGETGIIEELTNNGNPPVSSEARGPDEEDASTDVPSPHRGGPTRGARGAQHPGARSRGAPLADAVERPKSGR